MMKITNASIPNSVIKLVYPLIVNWLYVGVLRLLISHEFLPPMAEYLTRWGPGLLRLGAIMSFGGYCVSRPGLLRLGAVVG